MDCLNRHDYDRDKCLDFFQAYRDCKKAWVRPIISFPSAAPFPSRTLIYRILRWNNARQTAAPEGYRR
jgi:hypothetical protein